MNIYIRCQDNDLLKYLSDEQCAFLLSKSEQAQLRAGDYVFADKHAPDCFILVQQGELELRKPNGNSIANVFPGEVDGEACFLEPNPAPYYLQAVKPTSIIKLPYHTVQSFISENPEHGARIHAAINDSLCLKLIRLTHRRNHG